MKKHIKNILMIIFLSLAAFCYSGASYAADCPGAKTASQADVGDPTKPEASGVFDSQILEQMQGLMVGVYKTLSQISMFGHSLVCYAQTPKLGAIEVKLISWDIFNITPSLVIWDFSMLLCGVFVFIVGILTSYAIGMYFVDISFKIGFAVLFLPVTVALWPFKPTTQKFMDNLFIIIRNSMLFAMVAITVAFSTELIAQGLKLDEYWALVDMGVAQSAQVKQMYSLSTTRFLVIAFVLIFSFKILTASVEKFLDFFFNDPAFGSESPMHQMGTQAVGMAWQMTGAQALSYAGDVAMNMTGKAMIATGNSLGRMSKGDFSDIKKLGHAAKSAGSAVIHPMRTTRRAVQATRRAASSAANSALRAAGTVAKDLHDIKSLLKPGDFYEQEYREKQSSFNSRVDNFTAGGVRNAAKQTVSAGIAKAANATGILMDTAGSLKQPGSIKDKASNAFHSLKGENTTRITTSDVRSALHDAKQDMAQMASDAGAAIKQAAPAVGQYVEEKAKGATAAGVAAASQVAAAAGLMDPAQAMTTQQARAALHSGKQRAEAFVQSTKDNIQMAGQFASTVGKMAATYADQHTQGLQHAASATADWTKDKAQRAARGWDPNKTNISLSPSAIISSPFKLAGGIGNTIATLAKLQAKGSDVLDPNREQAMKNIWNQSDLKKVVDVAGQFAQETVQDYRSIDGGIARKAFLGTGKVVIKKGGQIVVRTAKDTAQDTAGALSKVFIGFGKELTNRGRGKSGWEKWKEKENARKEKELKEQEDRLTSQSLADKYDE